MPSAAKDYLQQMKAMDQEQTGRASDSGVLFRALTFAVS